jgi:hypothetical protein
MKICTVAAFSSQEYMDSYAKHPKETIQFDLIFSFL